MKHYVCIGECEGMSEKPAVCHAEDCSKQNEPFAECDCSDGRHEEVREKDSQS